MMWVLTQNTANVDKLPEDAAFRRICSSIADVRNGWNNMTLQNGSNVSGAGDRYGWLSIIHSVVLLVNLHES